MHSGKLGAYLKEKRKAAGLSQIEVSESLGYASAQFVSNWERATAKPPLRALAKLIKLYRLDIEETINCYLSETKSTIETVLLKRSGKRSA